MWQGHLYWPVTARKGTTQNGLLSTDGLRSWSRTLFQEAGLEAGSSQEKAAGTEVPVTPELKQRGQG